VSAFVRLERVSVEPMSKRVICLSHSEGTGGAEIGRLVAERLGYRYADDEIVSAAAHSAGFYPEAVALAESRKTGRSVEVDFGRAEKTDKLRDLICAAIVTTAAEGDVVIVAHAASFALVDRDDVLRVLVTGSPEARSRSVGEAEGLDAKAAARIVKESDRGRGAYLKRFYDVDDELSTHYDLVVNSDRVSPQKAVQTIVAAAA
jgi:cytidylate kinase